jgi:tryptophanyl-tRNA synthetase
VLLHHRRLAHADDAAGEVGHSEVPDHIREMVLDYLACGIDPERSHDLRAVGGAGDGGAEPGLRDAGLAAAAGAAAHHQGHGGAAHLDVLPFGLVGYPVLQAADILLPRADVVPVGRDNVPHVEITREIARRFNYLYGEVFAEPEALISDTPTLPGVNGMQKMSKSLDNAIMLSDDARTVRSASCQMYTDPNRLRADIPGTVEGNPVFIYHDAFNMDIAEVDDLKQRYREGRVGDVEVKKKLYAALETFLEPIRERRAASRRGRPGGRDPGGRQRRMRGVARDTLERVREAMGITYFRR